PTLESMIAHSDIIVTNFKSGDAEKFNLTSEVLFQINPQIIHAKISGFEHQHDRVAYDLVLQAETGMMSMNGTPESGPIKMPVAFIDLFASHQLKEGILCALLERHKTGRGGIVSCSLEAAAIGSLANQASNYLMSGLVAKRQGSLHPNIAPYGEMFSCKSGEQITLAIGSDRQFADVCVMLGLENLISDDRFSTNASRLKHRIALAKVLEQAIAQIDWEPWSRELLEKRIPFGVIRSLDEVFAERQGQEWILDEVQEGVATKRVRTVMFRYEPSPMQQGFQ
ncbi:MAG: CaiB/BaiF CoA transferase family protein, partial [Flavobacteriales bacterium]